MKPRADRSLAGLRSALLFGFGISMGVSATLPAAELAVRLDAGARELIVTLPSRESGEYFLRVVTPGLAEYETGADVNEPGIVYLPPASGPFRLDARIDVTGAENLFFFHSLRPAEGWRFVATFPSAPAGATWKLNGSFGPLGGALSPTLVMPVTGLEPGENLLHVRGAGAVRPHLAYEYPLTGDEAFVRVPLLSPVWSGEVTLVQRDATAATLARASVSAPVFSRRESAVPVRWWQETAYLRDAAIAVGNSLLASQVREPGSRFQGGFHLVFDPTRHSHRMAHWLWAWGPAIHFLFELERLGIGDTARSHEFGTAALAAAARSLDFNQTEPGHPANGVSTVRWEPSRAVPGGWVEYLSTADSLFLAGWGWMSAYRQTGDERYLRRTRELVVAAERLMAAFPVVPQDWVVPRQRWTPHTLDESVFGMIGFRALHQATADAQIAASGRRFLDSHLEHMGREDGLLERAWLRDEDRAIWDPDIKGHAWVVEGYLDAYALSGEARYLDLARNLAQRVIACQGEDGAWTYGFERPGTDDPRDDKGTAIWAYMLYHLHRITGDATHLASARRALEWCLKQQYRGKHPQLDGALLHPNAMAYVRRRPMTILYSTTFMGQALLEELALATRR